MAITEEMTDEEKELRRKVKEALDIPDSVEIECPNGFFHGTIDFGGTIVEVHLHR